MSDSNKAVFATIAVDILASTFLSDLSPGEHVDHFAIIMYTCGSNLLFISDPFIFYISSGCFGLSSIQY